MVFSVARRITGNHHDAEDVTQACFADLANQADRVETSLGGWLHGAATRKSLHVVREQATRRKHEDQFKNDAPPPVEMPGEGSWMAVGPRVDEALDQLPDKLREPLIAHFLNGVSQREIARQMGVSRSVVARIIDMGVYELRRKLAKGGVVVGSVAALMVMLSNNTAEAVPATLSAGLGKLALAGFGNGGGASMGLIRPDRLTLIDKLWMGAGNALAAGGVGGTVAGTGPVAAWAASIIALLSVCFSALAMTWAVFPSTQPAAGSPYDTIKASYSPYLSSEDPLAFPMKVRSLSHSSYAFWRGTKDLFYQWAREHKPQWLADQGAYVLSHGDLHVGNVGTYVIDDRGGLALGMVDFDDVSRLPVQLELLQGLVTMRLAARQQGFVLSPADVAKMDAAMFDAYALAVKSDKSPAELAGSFGPVAKMLSRSRDRRYATELAEYVDPQTGRFVGSIMKKQGRLKELLVPAGLTHRQVAVALAEAVTRSPALRDIVGAATVPEIEESIVDVVRRTRMDSSGSQGQSKLLVLIGNKGTAGGQTIIYLKQQIPPAVERVGLTAADPREPGRRVAESMSAMLEPDPYYNTWTTLDGLSYWVTLKEPWSDELDAEEAGSVLDLQRYARIWGYAAGATHRGDAAVGKRLTPELFDEVSRATDAYLVELENQYRGFVSDARASADSAKAEQAIAKMTTEMTAIPASSDASQP